MKLNCLIVDDEQVARVGLAEDIKELGLLNLCGAAENANQALKLMQLNTIDLLFLDVNMPGMNGFEFLRSLKIKPMVIIITAHREYALDGFDQGVVDYLLKPVSPERLKIACIKAVELNQYHLQSTASQNSKDFFYVKTNGLFEKILYRDILYIEAANNYIFIHTPVKKFMVYLTMKAVGEQLPDSMFIRVHKSYLVAKEHIEQIAGKHLVVKQTTIPVSRNFKNSFRKNIFHPEGARH